MGRDIHTRVLRSEKGCRIRVPHVHACSDCVHTRDDTDRLNYAFRFLRVIHSSHVVSIKLGIVTFFLKTHTHLKKHTHSCKKKHIIFLSPTEKKGTHLKKHAHTHFQNRKSTHIFFLIFFFKKNTHTITKKKTHTHNYKKNTHIFKKNTRFQKKNSKKNTHTHIFKKKKKTRTHTHTHTARAPFSVRFESNDVSHMSRSRGC